MPPVVSVSSPSSPSSVASASSTTAAAASSAASAGPGSPAPVSSAGSAGRAGRAAGAAPSPIVAIGAPTGSVSPSWARIASTPESGASTVMFALSLSISTIGSPLATSSPSDRSHWRTVPSSIVSLSLGMRNSAISPPHDEGPHRRRDVRRARQRRLLEVLGVRHRDVGAVHAPDRRVQPVEAGLVDVRGEVGRHAALGPALVDDHGPAGRPHALRQALEVERAQRAWVDHVALDALLGELVGGGERDPDHPRVGDHRAVAAAAADRRAPERHQVLLAADRPLLRVEALALEEDHRVVVADRRL